MHLQFGRVRPVLQNILLFLFFLFLPTQLGKHFFFDFSYVNGVRIDYLAPTVYLLDILAIGLFAFNWRSITNHVQKHAKIVSFMAVFVGINIFLSREPAIALYTTARYIEMYLLFVVFSHLDPSPGGTVGIRITLLPLLISSVVELGLSVYHIWAGQSIQGVFYWLGERAISASTPGIATISLFDNVVLRPYGTFSHPNSMGGFYLLIYTFVLWFVNHKLPQKQSMLRWGVLLTSSCLIFVSFSKIAILGFLIVNAYFLVKGIKLDCKLCKIARIVTLGVVSLLFLSGRSDILSWDKRILLLKQSVGVLAQHPLFGVGLGNSLYFQTSLTNQLPYSFIQPVHNIFLLLITEVGFMSVLLVVAYAIWQAREPSRLKVGRYKALYLCLLVVALTGFFDHYWLTLIQNQIVVGTILGLVVSDHKRAV